MPIRTTILVFSLIVAAALGSAWASASLKSTMRSWKADAATLDRMLTGSSAFDEAEAARVLHRLDADAQAIIARVSGTSAPARGVKSRFEKFSADVRSTIESVGSRDELKARYLQLRAECRACHDIYAK